MKKIKKIKSITHIYTDQYNYFGVLYIYIYVELQIVKEQYTYMCNCGRVVCINDVNKIKKKKSARHKYIKYEV